MCLSPRRGSAWTWSSKRRRSRRATRSSRSSARGAWARSTSPATRSSARASPSRSRRRPAARSHGVKDRFVREARVGNRLGKTKGFVRAFDWGELPTATLYLAMDLVEGAASARPQVGTLARARSRGCARRPRSCRRPQAAASIHRDLKPANFLQGSRRRALARRLRAREVPRRGGTSRRSKPQPH